MKMVRSSITKKHPKGGNKTERIDEELEIIQRQAGSMQEYLAEARLMKSVHERNGSGFQRSCFVNCITSASFLSERLTEKMRQLVIDNCIWEKEREAYGLGLVKLHGINVIYEKAVLKVELPSLLPHRKNYTDYLYKPVYLALERWCVQQQKEGLEIPLFEQATVCFLHVYDKRRSPERIRDHDNIEEKQMLDALGMFFLVSDGGLYLNTYHTTVLGEEDQTCLFLMSQECFPQWICAMERKKTISKKEGGEKTINSIG